MNCSACLQEGFRKLPALRQKDELLWALASARLLNLSDAQRRKGPPTKSVMGAFDWEGVVETLLQGVIDARDEAIANASLIVGNLLCLRHVRQDEAFRNAQLSASDWMDEVSLHGSTMHTGAWSQLCMHLQVLASILMTIVCLVY